MELQAANIGYSNTQHGWIDFRLHKSAQLSAVSRQHIHQRTKELREGTSSSFRSYKEVAKDKRKLELAWSKSVQEKMRQGSYSKRELALIQERQKLCTLEELKESGGPFTSAEQVDAFLLIPGLEERMKKKRMKMEIQYARDSTPLLPKVDPMFRIGKTLPNEKQREKTSIEFGDSLMVLLGLGTPFRVPALSDSPVVPFTW